MVAWHHKVYVLHGNTKLPMQTYASSNIIALHLTNSLAQIA